MDVKSLIILICFCILILCFNPFVEGDIPFGLCANHMCSVPISKGKTILQYSSPDDQRISVGLNEDVEIYVKDYGLKKDLWGVIVRGNKGYISKQFIREYFAYTKVLVPATVEFKAPHHVSSPYIVNSHMPSQHHESDRILNSVPESLIHTQTAQREDVISPLPQHVHSQFNKPSESLHSSHFNPSHQENFHLRSHFEDMSVYDVPELSSIYDIDYEDVISPSHAVPLKSGNTHMPDMRSSFHQNSLFHDNLNSISDFQLKNQPHYSNMENFQSSSAVPNHDFKSFNEDEMNIQIQQQQQHMQQPQHHMQQPQHHMQQPHHHMQQQQHMQQQPPLQQQQPLHTSNLHQQQIHPTLSVQQQHFQSLPNFQQQPIHPSQSIQQEHLHASSIHQQPPSIQQQHIHQKQSFQQPPTPQQPPTSFHHLPSTQKILQPPSNILEDGYPMDEEYSKTLAIVQKLDDNSASSHSQPESFSYHSSQDFKPEFGLNQADLGLNPSHSQHSVVPNSIPSTHSSPIMEPSIVQESEMPASEVFERNVDSISSSKDSLENINDLLSNEKIDLDAEVEDVTEGGGEDINEEDEEEDFIENLIAKNNIETSNPVLESSMSVTEDQMTLEAEDSQMSISSFEEPTVSETQQEKAFSAFSNLELNQASANSDATNDVQFENDADVMSNYIDKSGENDFNATNNFENPSNVINPTMVIENSDVISEHRFEKGQFSNVSDRNNNDALFSENSTLKPKSVPQINDLFAENESELNEFVNNPDIDRIDDPKNTYQVRNLKGESANTEERLPDSEGSHDENITETESDVFSSFENGLNALKSFVDSVMSWIPEPLYSLIMDLQHKGISPRVPVFTAICGFIIILLIVPLYFIKEHSKETKLSTQLASVEKDAYTLSATNAVLEEKLQSVQSLLKECGTNAELEKLAAEKLRIEFEEQKEELENTKAELESCLEEIESFKDKDNGYLSLLNDHAKEKKELNEQKDCLEKLVKENEDTIANLTDQLQEMENNLKELENEKSQFMQLKDDYEEKLSQFESNCNQLLQEAEVWNLRVNELTVKVNEERATKEEIETSIKEKDEEIESLKQLVETFKSFEEIEDPEEKEKTKEEKLQTLMKSSMILNQLEKQVQETNLLSEQLEKEKNKILDMEVELLEAKSEIDKLKLSYNQALQDKAEAQTKLDVLTNYFKDKEIQLQRQLGVHEAVRQKKEEDASSAERRIILIEQENVSYKYQVASMKQEMEETERNLKSQIAVQEKKAHENWIAARAAERKLEETKQEITQLRQRLTLMEREHENWANASRDEIIRPVPKRIPGANDEPGSQDMNTSERGMFPHPHERPPPPPMMLPLDRPLPPLLPPPMMFMPPMERHYRPPLPPWHLPPDPNSDFRSTPPEFIAGREMTPPRGRPYPISDNDTGPHASSPLTTDTRDSRNSTPPHLLPDFHDIPPQPGRPPFFPPPHHRLPMHPPFRRDMGPGPKRLDNPNEFNSRGSQQPQSSHEQWQHSRV